MRTKAFLSACRSTQFRDANLETRRLYRLQSHLRFRYHRGLAFLLHPPDTDESGSRIAEPHTELDLLHSSPDEDSRCSPQSRRRAFGDRECWQDLSTKASRIHCSCPCSDDAVYRHDLCHEGRDGAQAHEKAIVPHARSDRREHRPPIMDNQSGQGANNSSDFVCGTWQKPVET